MKIAFFEVAPWEEDVLDSLSQQNEVTYTSEKLDADHAGGVEDAEIISTFINSRLDAETLGKFDNLKLISTRSTGFNHIDMDYCKQNDIAVATVPDYGDNTVAEHVFALLLAISHNIIDAVDRTRKGDFSLQGLRGFDLNGKTLGIVGTGNIGLFTCSIAKGFGMKVLAFDVKPREEKAKELGFDYVGMDQLLAQSDVVSLHVPLNDKTKHMIGSNEFDQMKNGAILINTARGDIVDENALLQALSSGKLRAAGLDVLPEEPAMKEEAELLRRYFAKEHDLETLLADHILLRMKNVIVTPHSAFDTEEAVRRILDTTIDNIQSFIAGNLKNTAG